MTSKFKDGHAVIIVLAVAILLFFAFIEIEDCVVVRGTDAHAPVAAKSRDAWNFWIQMFTGSSWPDHKAFSDQSCSAFSLAAAVHVLLNIAAGLGFIWMFVRVVADRGKSMQFAKLIALRDATLKAEVLNLILQSVPAAQQSAKTAELNRAFASANQELAASLEIIVGSSEADRVMKLLEKDI